MARAASRDRLTPAAALARLGEAARGVRVHRLLHAGVLKRSYLAECSGERLVLRIDEPGAARLGLDRARELRILRRVALAGLGPRPVAASPRPPAILLLEYLPGRVWTPEDLSNRRRLSQIAGLLRRVHQISVPGAPLDPLTTARSYARLVPGLEKKLELADFSCLMASPRSVLCHHDPNAGNIVGARKPGLLDWEYAAPGNPLFDLAVVIRHHRLDRAHTTWFLSTYFEGQDVPAREVAAWCRAYASLSEIWEKAVALCHLPLEQRQRRC